MPIKITNNAFSELAAGINTSATSITLTTGTGSRFPTLGAGDYFWGTIVKQNNVDLMEIVKVTARSGDTLTVVRAQEGTVAGTWDAFDKFELRITAQTMLDYSDAAAFTGVLSIAQGGTGSATDTAARAALNVPTRTGGDASGTWGISITGNAATVTNGVYTNTAQTISGVKTFSNGLIIGNTAYANYEGHVEYGADAAGTWKRIAQVVVATGQYQTIGFRIEVLDPQANHMTTAAVDNLRTEIYDVACVRTVDTVQDTPDACYVRGPGSRIRATKTATGTYEIHIQNDGNWREYKFRAFMVAVNGAHTVNWYNGDTASAGTAQYNASVSTTARDFFQNVTVRQLTSNVATGTAPFAVSSTTRVANLNVATAGTADAFTTGRTISLTGDVTGTSGNFDGSANLSFAATLANSGVAAGTYGGNNSIPSITFDAKGRATAASTVTPSGTWGINITGNAASATAPTFSGDSTSKDNITTRTDSGFWQSDTGTTAEGWPLNDNSWQHLISCTHSNDSNYYAMQIAAGFYSQNWYFRNTNGSGTTGWSTMLHSGNYNSYSPTLTGGNASGTWGISITGTSRGVGTTDPTIGTGGLWVTSAAGLNVARNGTAYVVLDAGNSIGYPSSSLGYEDNRTVAPSELAATRMKFGFTSWNNNDSGPYADFLHLRSYTDSSGGNDNLVMFRKDAIGMRIWQQSFGSASAYSSYVDVLHSGNYTSYVAPAGGSWYGSGLPGSRWYGYSVNGGEIVFGRDLPNNGQMGMLIDGCYIAGENNGFWSLASDNTWGSRRGFYWDGTNLNFTTNSPTAVFSTARASQITAGGSTNTDANFGVQGTSHLTGTIYYGGTVGNVNSWSSISTSSGGTHTFSGSRFIFDRYGYGSQPLIDMQSGSITFGQPTYAGSGITVNNASGDGRGINLYSGSPTSPTYGLFFATTGNFGTYGAVSADWATYFTMNSTANRGWIFREVESLGNVAAISNQGNMTLRSHFEQGNNIARPNVSWSAGGNSTGMVIFYLPGTTSNYGMVHMVFDIYEYNGNAVSTVIVGGHNWSTSWYNVGANVIGQCGKEVRLGCKDGRFCVVFGTSGSSWEYGTIVLRKIHNGGFYDNIMDMVGNWSATQTTTESFTNITGDLRALRTPASFNAGGSITTNGLLNVSNGSGTMTIGPQNTSHCHLTTDRSNFYFNTDLQVNGVVRTYADPNNRFQQGALILRNSSPTVYFRDTDHNVAMLHCNSNVFYVLRGATDSESWSQVNGYWPLEINLTNNNAQFGNDVTAIGNVTAYSDERLKTDWAFIGSDFVLLLAGLKAGTYTRTDTGERQAGVSAQQMRKILPEVVSQDDKGTLALAYGNAAMVSAVELAKELVALKREIEILKSKLH